MKKTEDEPVDTIELDLNMDSDENVSQQECSIQEVYRTPGREFLQESLELHN